MIVLDANTPRQDIELAEMSDSEDEEDEMFEMEMNERSMKKCELIKIKYNYSIDLIFLKVIAVKPI